MANLTILDREEKKVDGCPEVVSTRPEPDVQLLIVAAKKDGFGRNLSHILNKCARAVLTPRYGTKRIKNLQDKMGIKAA